MPDRLTMDDFATHVGDAFALRAHSLSLDLELLEATASDGDAAGDRQPFTLTFRGPAEPVIAQQTVPLEHHGLGRIDIFLVAVGRDADGVRYEAVFT